MAYSLKCGQCKYSLKLPQSDRDYAGHELAVERMRRHRCTSYSSTSNNTTGVSMPNSNDYPYVRAWCAYMGSRASYIKDQVELAQHEDAPPTAVYRMAPGSWTTIDDIISDETRQKIKELVTEQTTS